MFLPYLGMAAILFDGAAILFDGAESFEQTGNTLLTEGPMRNHVKIAQAV